MAATCSSAPRPGHRRRRHEDDVFENVSGAITKISTGPLGGNGNFNACFAGATDDADYVFFGTGEPLTSDDQDASGDDLFVRHDGATELISTGPRGGTGNYSGIFDGVSEDGERVFFTTSEKLVTADTDQEEDVYMRWQGGPPSVRIDEFALTPDPFVELLKSGEGQEEFPDDQGPYKLVVYDGDGDEVGEHVIAPELLRAQTRPLFSDTHPQKDEPLEVALPAVGQMCFTQGVGEVKVDCVAWGCIATPVQQDITRVAAPGADLSEQRQGDAPEVFNLASPTPKEVNVAGTTPPACPTEPEPEPTNPGPGSGAGGSGGAGGAGGRWRHRRRRRHLLPRRPRLPARARTRPAGRRRSPSPRTRTAPSPRPGPSSRRAGRRRRRRRSAPPQPPGSRRRRAARRS